MHFICNIHEQELSTAMQKHATISTLCNFIMVYYYFTEIIK